MENTKILLSNLSLNPENSVTINLGDLVLLFIIVSIGNVGFNEWLKSILKSLKEKNWIKFFCGIVNLVIAIIAGISIKLILYADAHWVLSILLILSSLAITQLAYQTILQGIPNMLNHFFGGFKDMAIKMATQSVCIKKEDKQSKKEDKLITDSATKE